MSAIILKPEFGSTLVLVVEIAYGVSPSSNSAGWTWTDVTSDVLTTGGNGIAITRGRQDESSTAQAAQCGLTLRNSTGKYSQGNASPNYPNIRRNTPIRVRLVLSGVSTTRFWGYVTSWTPQFDTSGRFAIVVVQANGALQRLAQGNNPLQSVMTRAIPGIPNKPIAYWPCEDSDTATTLASGFASQPPMTITKANPTFAGYSEFLASKPIPTVNGSSWHGHVNSYTLNSPNLLQFQFFFRAPSGTVDNAAIAELHTESIHPVWAIFWYNGGDIALRVFDYWGVNYFTGAHQAVAAGISNSVVFLQLQQSGANVIYNLGVYDIDLGINAFGSQTFTGATLGKIESVHMFPQAQNSAPSAGQIIVQRATDTITTLENYYLAYGGESPVNRVTRLGGEVGEPVTVVGTSSLQLGEQLPASLVELLQECASSELGLLADGINQGPTFYTRESTDAIPATMTLDATKGEFQKFEPVDDDQFNVNVFTAQRARGSSAMANDAAGKFGTSAIGIYSSSATFSTPNDQELQHYANWAIHKGTTFGPSDATSYRYPGVVLNLHRTPTLAATVLGVDLLERIDLTKVHNVLSQQQDVTISLQVQGYTEAIAARTWEITYVTSPYEVSRVGVFAATTGDVGEFVTHFESDGSSLASGAALGATSLSVSTPSGPLWTTVADDFPFQVNILDIPVTVTNVSGAASPQTFTVTGVTKALTSGSTVRIWNNPVMEL